VVILFFSQHLTIFFKETNENIVKEYSLCIYIYIWATLHPGKKKPTALYYSRQIVLQNYEFEKEEEDPEDRKIKTLFHSSSLQARL
jgi:hypothetical protein